MFVNRCRKIFIPPVLLVLILKTIQNVSIFKNNVVQNKLTYYNENGGG